MELTDRLKQTDRKKLNRWISILLALLFFIPSSVLSSAQEDLSVLEERLQELPKDTSRINALLILGEAQCSKKNDIALIYLQEAFTLATSLNYTKGIGQSLLWQGRVYYYKDEYPLSIQYLEMAEEYLKLSKDNKNLAFLNFIKGENYRICGDNIRAMNSYNIALELAIASKDIKSISTYYSSIGNLLLDRNEPKKAMEYFREALQQTKNINDLSGVSNQLTSFGKSFEILQQLDSSLWYYNKALKIRTQQNNIRTIASSEYSISGILYKMQRYEDAELSLQIALKNFIELDDKTGIIITNLRLAKVHNKEGKANAIESALMALEHARKIKNTRLVSHAYKILSEIYEDNQDYQKAFEYLYQHKILNDSLFNTEKERILTEMETKFQSEKKDNKIDLLNTRSKTQRKNNILLVIFVIIFAGVTVLLFFLFRLKSTAYMHQKKMHKQEELIHQQQRKIIEKEKQILQEQLESKNRELASKALEMLRFNNTISCIIEKLENLNNDIKNGEETAKSIKDIIHDLDNPTKQNIWNEFEKIFKNIHSDFYSKLLEICPELSATEIKTAALLKLNLTTKEIAAISFKSEGSIKTTRYRLRKKLGLQADDGLVPFLMQF